MVEFKKKAFLNERLTYRFHVLAEEAINANDGIFMRAYGCSIRELRILRIIDEYPGVTFKEIVTATQLERSLASRLIRRLLSLDLIQRKNDRDDGRRYELFVTEAGKRTRLGSEKLSDELEELLLSPLPPEALDTLKATLDRLALWIRSSEYQERISAFQSIQDRLPSADSADSADGADPDRSPSRGNAEEGHQG